MRKIVFVICLSYAMSCFFLQAVEGQAQTPTPAADPPPMTDIFLAEIEEQNGRLLVRTPVNVTNRTGYDNQPHFLADGSGFFYVSVREDDQADVYLFRINNSTHTRITSTGESEYSPTIMPDGKFFSVVRVEKDEAQRLWKFPLEGGDAVLISPDLKPVGYHCWIDSENVVAFLLGEPHTLHVVRLPHGETTLIAESVGRAIHPIPSTRLVSFIHKKTEEEWWMESYDIASGSRKPLIRTPVGSEDFTWFSDNRILMARGSKLYQWEYPSGKEWEEVADLTPHGIRGMTRIAVPPNRRYLALVAEE